MKLYSYFRSSAAYRVRIALNLKNVPFETVPVNLVSGDQRGSDYRSLNAQGLVPTLELDDGRLIHQSLAICEWIDSEYPDSPLLPNDSYNAAQVRASALTIACEIHPVNNLRMLKYLEVELGVGSDKRNDWYRHWVMEGFNALEESLEADPYCFGTTPGLADVFLVPQVFNARRFDVDMDQYPKIVAVDKACNCLQAFKNAHPDLQPDHPAVNSK